MSFLNSRLILSNILLAILISVQITKAANTSPLIAQNDLDVIEDYEPHNRGKVHVLTFDTSTTEGCNKLQSYLSHLSIDQDSRIQSKNSMSLCSNNRIDSMISIIMLEPSEKNLLSKENLSADNITYKYDIRSLMPKDPKMADLVENTLYVSFAGVGIIGGISLLPEEISNWDENQRGYFKNIKKLPHMDKDEWAINYVGHPYAGAMYYMIARHSGLSRLGSFGYSFFMSTFFWEFGVEAYFEQPSIQDLIVTPIVGTLLGMIFEYGIERIEQNNGALFGSSIVGKIATTAMNPTKPLLSNTKKITHYLSNRGVTFELVLGARIDPLANELQDFSQEDPKEAGQWSGVLITWKTEFINDLAQKIYQKNK